MGSFRIRRTPPGPEWIFNLFKLYEEMILFAFKNNQSVTPTCLKKRIGQKLIRMCCGIELFAGEKNKKSLSFRLENI
jgi:hypothetical protein